MKGAENNLNEYSHLGSNGFSCEVLPLHKNIACDLRSAVHSLMLLCLCALHRQCIILFMNYIQFRYAFHVVQMFLLAPKVRRWLLRVGGLSELADQQKPQLTNCGVS